MQNEAMITSAVLRTVIPFFLKARKLSALFNAISVFIHGKSNKKNKSFESTVMLPKIITVGSMSGQSRSRQDVKLEMISSQSVDDLV